jgi:curved DNA-binding protein CbpA
MKNELPDMDAVLQLSSDPTSLFQDIEFTSVDKAMLSLIDGKKTIKKLIESSTLGSFDALRIIYTLWSTGTIEKKERIIEKPEETLTVEEILKPASEEEEAFVKKVDEIYSKLNKLSPSELLEVNENSDAETVRRNYFSLAKEFHPDRHFDSDDPAIKDKLPAIFDTITQAYTLLKDDSARKEYFHSLDKVQREEVLPSQGAEEQFKQGVEEFKKGNFWGAADSFKWAIKQNQENARYWSYLSLAYSKMDKRLKDAEEALFQAIRLDPLNPDHYAHLGYIYLRAGMNKRAYTQFEKALRIDPKNAKAQKGLKQTGG